MGVGANSNDACRLSLWLVFQLAPGIDSLIGTTYVSLENFEQANLAFTKVFVEAHLALGQALAEIGEIEKAKTAFDRCLVLRPDWEVPLNELRKLGFV